MIRSANTRPIDASFHHGSHRQLLVDVPLSEVDECDVDAIIVPAARPAHWLREAFALAAGLGCGLVAMCSHSVEAAEVAELGDSLGVPLIAVDIEKCRRVLPGQAAAALIRRPGQFSRTADTAVKRNLGLVLARAVGWQRVVFMDDDIHTIEPAHARAAAGLLDRFDVVGMHNVGYPDNSVVCHANRELARLRPDFDTEEQDEFIGAGAMAVAPARTRSHFPDVYNEDWFFLLGHGLPMNIAITGTMKQKAFDPFANPDRARSEEFGDCLAEGLFWLLDHRLPVEHADIEHWRDFLSRRSYFVDTLLGQAHELDDGAGERRRMIASLEAAQRTCAYITPRLCRDFVHAWSDDLARWQFFLDRQPEGLGIREALTYLQWPGVVCSTTAWPSVAEDRIRCADGWRQSSTPTQSYGPSHRSELSSQFTPRPTRRRTVR